MSKKTLQEVLRENHEYGQWKEKIRQEELKREKRKNIIIFIIVSTFVLWLTFDKLISMGNNAVENCIKEGNSRIVCEYRVGL